MITRYFLQLRNFSFEKSIPAHWYRKLRETQQRCKQKILTKIPRINITSSDSNTFDKILDYESSWKEETENSYEHRYLGKGKEKEEAKTSMQNRNRQSRMIIRFSVQYYRFKTNIIFVVVFSMLNSERYFHKRLTFFRCTFRQQ